MHTPAGDGPLLPKDPDDNLLQSSHSLTELAYLSASIDNGK